MTPSGGEPSTPASPAIEARGLTRTFGHRVAVDGVDLVVRQGESLALFGPNGSGKTTLLRTLTSTLRPTRGTFRIAGRIPRDARDLIGALYHQSFLYDDLTAAENLLLFARLYGVPRPQRRVDALLQTLGLMDRAEDPVRTFSRGMQQRVALARCLIHEPRIVFLDEPLSGLDPRSTSAVAEALQALRSRGHTLFTVTHELARGLELSDRWMILDRGRTVAEGLSARTAVPELEGIFRDRIGSDPPARRSRP